MSPASLFHKIKGGCEFPEELGVAGDVISHLGAIISTFFLHLYSAVTFLFSRITDLEL